MDTGIGDRENTGQHQHPATKVCVRDQMAGPTDQHQSPISQSQQDSDLLTVLLRHTTSMPAGHVGTTSEGEMWHA